MKRILLTSAFLLCLLAEPAAADDHLSEQCKKILSLPPVSPYVSMVRSRAEAGLAYANGGEVDGSFATVMQSWAEYVRSSMAEVAEPQTELIARAMDMSSATACLHLDVLMIQCTMEKVRDAMNAQIERGSREGVTRLGPLLTFLQDRLTQLLRGALDPEYQDPDWAESQPFDPPDSDFSESRQCPFTSDYAPPFQSGYGCDVETLQPRTAFTPLKTEYDTLKLITDQTNAFRDAERLFLTTEQDLATLSGEASAAFPPLPPPRTHRTAAGCDQQTNLPSFDLRGPFSLQKNHLDILTHFLLQRTEEGASRHFSEALKNADEYSSAQSSEAALRSNENVLWSAVRGSLRLTFQAWSILQGEAEALLFPQATDDQLEIAQSLSNLHKVVSTLAKLGHDKSGLRSFAINIAGFLRRSCIFRPCNASLEEVIKISTTDACFPYTNGEFLNDTPGSPRSKQCREAAKIAVP